MLCAIANTRHIEEETTRYKEEVVMNTNGKPHFSLHATWLRRDGNASSSTSYPLSHHDLSGENVMIAIEMLCCLIERDFYCKSKLKLLCEAVTKSNPDSLLHCSYSIGGRPKAAKSFITNPSVAS